MDFQNRRLITVGVDSNVSPFLQIFMWHCIDSMPRPKDYLQVFKLSAEGEKQKIEHIQEEPEYKREYILKTDAPILYHRKFHISYDIKNKLNVRAKFSADGGNAHGQPESVMLHRREAYGVAAFLLAKFLSLMMKHI